MKSNLIEIKAKLTLYSAQNGGRNSGIYPGYSPNHVFEYKENELWESYVGQIDFEKESILPNETENVTVHFLRNRNLVKLLIIGRIWWLHEGPRKIGEAKVLEMKRS